MSDQEEREIQDHALEHESELNPDVVDSSEEEESEDEEAIQKVRDGFIVDDEEEEGDELLRKRKKHRKRRHREAKVEDDGALDEDDLELMMENQGQRPAAAKQLKRLKRAGDERERPGGLSEIFSEDEAKDEGLEDGEDRVRLPGAGATNEFEDFIEDDEYSGEEVEREARRPVLRPKAVNEVLLIDNEKLSELYEIFGNGDDYAWALEGEEEGEEDEPAALTDVFEPSELKEKMLTDADNHVRTVDVPERFQTLRSGVRQYELELRAFRRKQTWVAQQLALEKHVEDAMREPFEQAVAAVVDMVLRQSLEVPFIWHHRRDFLLQQVMGEDGEVLRAERLLDEDDLWRIVLLDVEFHLLWDRKAVVERLWAQVNGGTPPADAVVDLVESAATLEELQDLHDYILFTYLLLFKGVRKHSRNGFYEQVLAGPLKAVIEAIGITAAQFGDNVANQARVNPTVDEEYERPADMVRDVDTSATDDDAVKRLLDLVAQTYAQQLAHDPRLRRFLRDSFLQYATVAVKLTPAGKLKVPVGLPFYALRYATHRLPAQLRQQPQDLLYILQAEADGWCSVEVQFPHLDQMCDHLFTNYLALDGVLVMVEEWNTLRKDAFLRATAVIVPNVRRQFIEQLRRDCERRLASEVRAELVRRLDQAPYTPHGYAKGEAPGVVAVLAGQGRFGADLTVAVYVRASGEVAGELKIDVDPMRDAERFTEQLAQFLHAHAPDVIAVLGFNAQTSRLHAAVSNCVQTHLVLVPEEAEGEEGPAPLVEVLYVRDETARVYYTSDRAVAEFVDRAPIARYCIGVARYVQLPLREYVALGTDLSLLALHPHQGLLTPEQFVHSAESALVDVVNMTGVELGDTLRDDVLQVMLRYVCGMGPRKALGLVQALRQVMTPEFKRDDLVLFQLTGAAVFMNCALFLRLLADIETLLLLELAALELLDGTRIHPQDYELARKMAADALELDEEDVQYVEQHGGVILKLKREGLEKLEELDLDGYASELEAQLHRRKRYTLHQIREELRNSYEELRKLFHQLDTGEVFTMLTGLLPEEFGVGKDMPVQVRSVKQLHLVVSTALMVEGYVRLGQMLSRDDYRSPLTVFHVGQTVTGVLTEMDYTGFKAEFSLTVPKAEAPVPDPAQWDVAAEARDAAAEEAKTAAETRAGRTIQHALFRNVLARGAEEYLAAKARGDAVIRPLSKGDTHLTVTWKVANNLFQHVDVLEEQRQTDYGVEKTFRVGLRAYLDLDELVYDYVQATARKVDDMCFNEFFLGETREVTLSNLEERSANLPQRVCYTFSFDHKAPGWFLLDFKINSKAKVATWHVKATPEGYRLKDYDYPDMNRLRNGFKSLLKSEMTKKGGW